MQTRTVAFVIAPWLCLVGQPAFAQSQTSLVNPQTIEFVRPVVQSSTPPVYRVDIFPSDADPQSAVPVRSIDVGRSPQLDGPLVRVEVESALFEVPDGQYVATLTAQGNQASVQSEPSPVFVLARGTVADRVEFERRERFWTMIGFAIVGGILLVPFLIQ